VFDIITGKHRTCDGVSRREFIKIGGLTFLGLTMPEVLRMEAAAAAEGTAGKTQARSVILLWMDGGPSQHETFDPKPDGGESKGEFGAISSNVAGIQVSELLPKMAQRMNLVTLVRTMQHNEGAHERADHKVLTGWTPNPAIVYPAMGSVVTKELGPKGALPAYVTVPNANFGAGYGQSGYLEASNNPFSVGGDPNRAQFTVRDLTPPSGMTTERIDNRRELLTAMDGMFRRFEKTQEATARNQFLTRAYDVISSPEAKKAFDLKSEPDALRDKYGRTTFGQSCLLARRMVEAGVRFVTVSFGGWDTHSDNFKSCKNRLLPPTDNALSALLGDLKERGLLDTTLVVWMGEFGRTPKINALAGRDHWPKTACAVFAGAGVPAGQLLGNTDKQGGTPVDYTVGPADVCATIYQKLGVDYNKQYITPQNRPVKILAEGQPIKELGCS
jgi:Protein of unknown function (DUF1501)